MGQKSKLLVYVYDDSFASKVLRIQVADRHNFKPANRNLWAYLTKSKKTIDCKAKVLQCLVYKIIIILYIFTSMDANKTHFSDVL